MDLSDDRLLFSSLELGEGGRQDCMAYTIHSYTEGQNPNAGQMLAIHQNSHDNNN